MNLANSFRKQKQAQIPLQIRLPMREAGFERYVGQVRALLGVNEAVIFDYLELLENAGLRIVFLPLGEKIKSLSCYDRANANAFLFVNSEGLSLERQLFRLSYELGRVYLYNGGMQGAMKIGALDAEHAARRFAALFLMQISSATQSCSRLAQPAGPASTAGFLSSVALREG